MLYPVAIRQIEQGFYACLPDLPELEVYADNMADIIPKARSAVIDHLQQLVENNQPMAPGSDVGKHLTNPDYAGWTWAIVTLEAYRIVGDTVDITLSLSERLLDKIQAHAAAHEMDLQRFFIESAKQAMIEQSNQNS